jgi:Caudovirus prohead serine protease
MQIEHKSTKDTAGTTILSTDESEGRVQALVSITGIRDNVNDIIEPGAYAKTLSTRKPKGVMSHNWDVMVAKALGVEEWMPGDDRLPKTLPNGEPWSEKAGALWIDAQFNMKTQAGRDAFETVKFYGDEGEWSIGYTVPKGKASEEKSAESPTGKIRRIKELNLFEFSPVLFGAASNARTLAHSIKSLVPEAREQFMKALEEDDNEETALAIAATAEGDVVENTEQTAAEKSEPEPVTNEHEEVSGAEAAEETKDTREMAVKVNLDATLYEQLKTLKAEIELVLAAAVSVSEEKSEDAEIEDKGIDEAIEALVDTEVEAKVVEDIENHVNTFVSVLEDGTDEEVSAKAALALDLIAAALGEVTDKKSEMGLKVLTKSIGTAIRDRSENTEEDTKSTPQEEVEEKVVISKTDLDALLDLKNLGI